MDVVGEGLFFARGIDAFEGVGDGVEVEVSC